MTILSMILISLSLSMDAFAVSVGAGISIRDLKKIHAIRASFFFGLFQFIMPVAGWYLGNAFAVYIQAFDHWIAFGLLAFIGGKMIWETLREKSETAGEKKPDDTGAPPEQDTTSHAQVPEASSGDVRRLSSLLTLSVATSIDALAVGLSFSVLGQSVWLPSTLIGSITFLVCLTGFAIGHRVGSLFKKWAGLTGGIVLVAIGIKILLEHLTQ